MPETLTIPCALDLLAAQSLRETLLQRLGTEKLVLEIEGITPTTASMQIFFAAYRSLSNAAQLEGLGPNGTALMAQVNI